MNDKYLALLSNLIKKILLVDLFPKWGSHLAEAFNQQSLKLSDEKSYIFSTTNPLLFWRAETLFEKEPITIQWLRSMKKDETFYDIGGNVGVYTIYAGARGVQVLSFEPEASNYYILNKNISLNHIQKNVKAYNIALSDSNTIDSLKITSHQPGSAHTTFGENDHLKQNNHQTIFEQGAISLTLDKFVYDFDMPIPHHIKIDVDGIEGKIIKGAPKLLQEKKIQSILIEVNEKSPEDLELIEILKNYGFKITEQSPPLVLADNKGVLRETIFRR